MLHLHSIYRYNDFFRMSNVIPHFGYFNWILMMQIIWWGNTSIFIPFISLSNSIALVKLFFLLSTTLSHVDLFAIDSYSLQFSDEEIYLSTFGMPASLRVFPVYLLLPLLAAINFYAFIMTTLGKWHFLCDRARAFPLLLWEQGSTWGSGAGQGVFVAGSALNGRRGRVT